MRLEPIITVIQWTFLLYFTGFCGGYLILNILSFVYLRRYVEERSLGSLPQRYSGYEPQISIIAPAYNESATIAASIRSLLQLSYSEYEIVVVNDGSKDQTLQVLTREFGLVPFPEAYDYRLPTKAIRAVYYSTVHANLRVIDKENGGKADALNAGINLSRYPLVCCVDADSILQRDSLQRVVQPFLDDPSTVACGGTVRVANGCEVSGGFLVKIGLPTNWLALFQIIEYLRAFLFGRMGWSPLNAVLIISGAFGLFHRDTIIAAGGYRHDTIGEDMELAVRLHRRLRDQKRRYRITFVPDPTCWTEAPEDLRTLKTQRIRWQRGLLESLWAHRDLLCGRSAGVVGWLAFPFLVLFEAMAPIVEIFGYLIMTLGFGLGVVSAEAMGAFLIVAIGFGVLLSVSALLLEEVSFHVYPRPGHLVMLFVAAVGENFGYRQLNAMWKLIGTYQWLRGKTAKWGDMTRTASWQSA